MTALSTEELERLREKAAQVVAGTPNCTWRLFKADDVLALLDLIEKYHLALASIATGREEHECGAWCYICCARAALAPEEVASD